MEDHILERTDLPDELIRNVQGHIAFVEENVQVEKFQSASSLNSMQFCLLFVIKTF